MSMEERRGIMARMNREILVPYLQDVCALHLAKKRCMDQLERQRADYEDIRRKMGKIAGPKVLREGQMTIFSILAACCCFGLPLAMLFWGRTGLLVGIFSAIAFVVLHLCMQSIRDKRVRKINEIQRQMWRQNLERHDMEIEQKCEPIKVMIANLEQEVRTIDILLNKVYSANLIPSRYRDIYAAVYLYDWFSTGMSDDMDMALNTYVLEQIKSRLDTIIRNQAEQIINQRAILANQARSMNMIERNAQQMRERVSRMNASLEQQNVYLKMIDSNVAATRYFAEETYKKWN